MTDNQDKNNNPYAVIIGGANMDICGAAIGTLISKDSNIGKIGSSSGGVARNIAENLALLGCNCHLLSAIGNDPFGQALINHITSVGIHTDNILKLENEKTSTYLSVLDGAGEMMVAINDMSIIENITPEYIKRHKTLIMNAHIIIADTNIPEETLLYLTTEFNSAPILIDTVSTEKALKIKDCLHGIHSLKTNTLEAKALTGISNNLSEMADWFHNRGVLKVYITMGSDGVFYSDANGVGEFKHQKNHGDVKNVTGAGDAFSAGVAYAYYKSWGMVKSVHFAMAAATCAINHENTINPEMSVKKITRIMEQEYDN